MESALCSIMVHTNTLLALVVKLCFYRIPARD